MAAAAATSGGFDVIVVGGGIMGSCAAYAAASSSASRGGGGARVLLLERFDLLHHRGSSHGESRGIRATYPQAWYPPMVHLAARLWGDAEAEAGYRVLTPTLHLDMGPRADPALRAAIDNGGAAVVAASDDSAAWPWSAVFRLPEGWTAAISELGGVIKATKAVAMFQSLAAKNGVVLRDRTEVVDIANKGPGREHELTPESGFPTFSSYRNTCIYSTPSMEFPGLIKVCTHGGAPCDPDRRDWCAGDDALADPVARWIDELMPRHVDTAGGPVIRQSCMYSMTPDVDFIIDFVGGEFGKDVVVGARFSGHGFKMGPAVGRILAEMAMDGEAKTATEAGVELGYFRIGRFKGNPEGNLGENKVKV